MAQADIHAGRREGMSTEDTARIAGPEKEVCEQRQANSILKTALSSFGVEFDLPTR